MIKLLLTMAVFSSFPCLGQENDSSLNISIWTPSKWYAGDKTLLHNNLTNYKFSKEELTGLENEINASKVFGIYYKYDPKNHYGFVPTIKVYIRQNSIKGFAKFFASVKNEIDNVKNQVSDFNYVDSPKTIIVGQRKAFYASSTYNLNIQTGEIATIRTKFACIPLNKTFLYITLIDNKNEDCSGVYQQVIDKIKIE